MRTIFQITTSDDDYYYQVHTTGSLQFSPQKESETKKLHEPCRDNIKMKKTS